MNTSEELVDVIDEHIEYIEYLDNNKYYQKRRKGALDGIMAAIKEREEKLVAAISFHAGIPIETLEGYLRSKTNE